MSRIGRQSIPLPPGVTVSLDDDTVTVQGPRGVLRTRLHPNVRVHVEDGTVLVRVRNEDDRRDRALWGLSRMLVANMVHGVTQGYTKVLEIHGVGYRVQVQGREVVLQLGFSHPVVFPLPEGIEAKAEGNTLTLSGIEKQLLGETAARIRAFRKPEPYKGKGVRYQGERVRRKAGKVVKGAAG